MLLPENLATASCLVQSHRYRAPYTTNSDFRKAVNNGEIAYNDIHLSQMAQEVRYGFMGKVNVASSKPAK